MNTILVTGATGNVGRPLVAMLAEAGASVRALTRSPESAGLPAGVTAVASPLAGLDGASAVFLNSRALGDSLDAVVRAARDAGVTRLVALSAINADDDHRRQPSRVRGDRNKEVEAAAVGSGLEWVSLRPTVFFSNFVGMWAPQLAAGDVIRGPYAEASTAPIVETDIAAVAARALLTDDLVGCTVPLTGPQPFTNAGLAAVMGEELGRRVRYLEVDAEEVRAMFGRQGFPTGFADAYLAMLAATMGAPAPVTDDVERITGRPAATVADGVRTHLRQFITPKGHHDDRT